MNKNLRGRVKQLGTLATNGKRKNPVMVAAGIKAAHTRKWRRAQTRAAYSARWSTTMTRWLISYCTSGKAWQVVGFSGKAGGESAGIVDLVAIRRNYNRKLNNIRPGDVFEMIFIQIKGGNAPWPSVTDVARLRTTAAHHRAMAVLLCEWKKGSRPVVYMLRRSRRSSRNIRHIWALVAEPRDLFS